MDTQSALDGAMQCVVSSTLCAVVVGDDGRGVVDQIVVAEVVGARLISVGKGDYPIGPLGELAVSFAVTLREALLVAEVRNYASQSNIRKLALCINHSLACRQIESACHTAQKDTKALVVELTDALAQAIIVATVVVAMACERSCYEFLAIHGIKDTIFGSNFALCLDEFSIKFNCYENFWILYCFGTRRCPHRSCIDNVSHPQVGRGDARGAARRHR